MKRVILALLIVVGLSFGVASQDDTQLSYQTYDQEHHETFSMAVDDSTDYEILMNVDPDPTPG
ncbi:hypothetical protein [Paraliobacillus ryukyuensis]|uniref:hypothetical protein n=1 Tax=Paraliobacillus ryukyuensis TaxID=200904 RepID=UPI0009A8AC79|nr:hypothetical protein [Paraliobacillus ryukyuensis]